MTGPPSDAILERLLGLHPKIIDLSLGRLERLLARLDHPESKLPPVVHVAGTNAKGSVIAYLRAIAEAAGLDVHAYTSPHLVRFHERIRLCGRLIEEAELAKLLEECEGANGEAPITFFEITTAAAFLAFSRQPADLLLLEVGLGGRLDATNVVEKPRLSIITPVSIDHIQYLGGSLERIAFEKAGILKPGVPAVIAPQAAAAQAVIEARAKEVGAPLLRHGAEWDYERRKDGLTVTVGGRRLGLPLPNLPGPHQAENAAIAAVAATALSGFDFPTEAIATGLTRADWPARFQHLRAGALVDLLPEGWDLWLDGGHNESAGAALAAALTAQNDSRPLHLVYGMMNTKAASGFLKPLAPLASDLKAVAIPGEAASLTAQEAAEFARAEGFEAEVAGDVPAALRAIAGAHHTPARVLICGSLYLAGKVLAMNEKNPAEG